MIARPAGAALPWLAWTFAFGSLLLTATLGPTPGLADETWYQAYDSALKAIAARQWVVAETKLKAAIRTGPRPGRNVRIYGVRFIDYLPGYYLGIACFNQQKYKEALEELQRVEASGLVSKRDPEFPQMTEMIEKASTQLAAKPSVAPPSPVAAETTRPSESQKEAETLVRFARDLVDQGHVDEARKALEGARTKDPANPSLAALGEAIARQAAERKAKAEQDLTGQQQRAASVEFAEALGELSTLAAKGSWGPARQKAADLSSRNSRDPELMRLKALIDKHFAEAEPVELEKTALRAFYSGKYETAAETLEPLARGKGRTARTLFYLACSNAAMGFFKGKEGEALLARAREQFAEARRLDPRLVIDRSLISPRIARIFEEARREGH